ncbi:MAG: Pr6Pr family membrane protein [Fibrella sp.]|nr:Pr6Pr family membrane protein [Armatimonadota bacterium]
MKKRFAVAAYRLSVSVLAAGTVLAQTVDGFFHPPFDYLDYFSFFSVQSNLLTSVILTASAIRIFRGGRMENLTFWRGAATLYLTLAGAVYFVLLNGASESLRTPREQTNAVLHYLVPAALLGDWFFADKEPIAFRVGLAWLSYPLLYVLYSLVRGRVIGWYPYSFLNPNDSGYSGVVGTCLVMAIAMTGFIALLTRSTRLTPPT